MADNPFASAADNPFAAADAGSADNPFQLDDEPSATPSAVEGTYDPPSLTASSNPFANPPAAGSSSSAAANSQTAAPSWASGATSTSGLLDKGPAPVETMPSAGPPGDFVPPWMKDGAGSSTSAPPAADSSGGKGKAAYTPAAPTNFFGGGAAKPATGATAEGLDERARQLEQRERELAQRERDLQARQNAMGDAMAGAKKPNYPPCFPLTRAAINEDVLEQNRTMVRIGFIAWHLTELGYIFNWICVVVLWQMDKHKSLTNFFFASIVAIAGIPFSYLFWWQALYRAGSINTSFAYIRFFWHFAFHTFWAFWMMIAIPIVGSYSCGIVDVILNLIQGQLVNAMLSLANVAIWGTVAALSVVVFRLAFQRWRGQGGQEELRQQTNTLTTVANTLFGGGGAAPTATGGV